MNNIYKVCKGLLRGKAGGALLGQVSLLVAALMGGLTATAQQQITLSTDTVSAQLSPGSSTTKVLTITNSGDAPLVISSHEKLDKYAPGETEVFNKANNTNWLIPANQDRITDKVWLTRDLTRSMFNAKSEVASSASSPSGTSWALGTVNEVAAEDFSTFSVMHSNDPQSLIGETTTLKIGDDYHSIQWTSYTGGNGGGGFSYKRTPMFIFYDMTTTISTPMAAGATQDLTFSISDEGLKAGLHYGRLVLNTDDPNNPTVTVVVELEVFGKPQFEVSVDSLMANVSNEEDTVIRTFTITNTGNSSLTWNGTTNGNDEGMCATFSTLTGTIDAGDSEDYTVTFTNACDEGTYEWPFVISAGEVEATLHLTSVVNGNEELEFDAPVFEDTYVGITKNSTLVVRSTGNAPLSVSNITSDNPAFTVTKKVFVVEPGESEEVIVRFKPTEPGTATGQLLIVSSNAADDSVYVNLSAVGIGAPVLSISPTQLSFSLESGESTRDSIAVYNSGDSDLIWKYSTIGGLTSAGVGFQKENYADINSSENQDQLTDSVYLVRGNSGPIYDYNGNTILFALGSAEDLSITDYTEDFQNAVNNNADELPGNILSIYIPEEGRYFDLHIDKWTSNSNGGGMKYTRYEIYKWLKPIQEFEVSEEVSFTKPNGADWTLAANQDRISDKVWITRQSNGAPFNIKESASWSSNTTTIKWALGNSADLSPASYSSDWRVIRNNLDNRLYSLPGQVVSLYLVEEDRYFDLTFSAWATSNSGGFAYSRQEVFLSEKTPVDETEYAVVEVTATLPDGTFSGSLIVESNDPLLPKATIPVSFTVTGGLPAITSTLDSVNFGTALSGQSVVFNVPIKNSGLGILELSAISSSNTAFQFSTTAFEVSPKSTSNLSVTINSDQVGAVTGLLTLTSNDPNQAEFEIELAGEILNLPSFSVSEVIIYDTLDYQTTGIQYLTLENTGLGELEWEIPYDIYVEKIDYELPSVAAAQDRITDNFWLTRADEQGFFNILEADEYEEEPATFEWGDEASTFLSNSYSYFKDNWRGSDLRDGAAISLHLIEDDLYFDLQFHQWTENGDGGGFAYERRKAVRWLGLDQLSGTIASGDDVAIPVNFDASATPAGDYEFSYTITTNDPTKPEQQITFYLHVDGQPEIAVSTDSVGLGEYPIGTTHTGSPTFTISNNGGADLEVALSSDNSAFSFGASSYVIPAAGSLDVATLFTPMDTLVYSGLITIISNDAANDTLQVEVTAEGYVGAELGLSTRTLTATLVSGGSIQKTIIVSNTGAESLLWNPGVAKLDKKDYADPELAENQDRINESTWLTRNDNGSLYNISENDPSEIKWTHGYSKDNSPSDYSTSWSSVRNGLPGGRFYSLPGQVVSLYVESEDAYYDLYFTKWTNSNQGGGVTYFRNRPGVFSILDGEIAEGEDQELIMTLDATGLDAGVYNYEYYIFHNGINKVDTLKAKLTVLGAPALEVTESVDFGVSPIGDETVKEIEVTNTGSSSGIFTLASNNPAFSVSGEEFKVKPEETITVEVSFTPSITNEVEGTITLTSNDPASATFEVVVTGSGSAPATIAVESPSLETSLFYGQTVTKSVTITNSGDFDLEWSLGVSGEEVYFEKVDYADPTLSENQDRVSDDLWITRGNNRGIYNILLESRYDNNADDSPLGSLWLSYPTSEAESLDDYTYWEDARNRGDLPGETYSMQDVESALFYDITWENWTEDAKGGGFSYTRKPVLGIYAGIEFSSKKGSIAPGESATLEITFNPNLDFDGELEIPLAIKSNDPANELVEIPLSLAVKGIIVDSFLGDELVNEGFSSKTIDLTGVFEDAQGDQLTYSASSSDASVVTVAILNDSITISEVGYGTAEITITAMDATGNTANDRFDFRVNAIPDALIIPDQVYNRLFGTVTLDIAPYFEDLDGDALSFQVTTSASPVVTAMISGSVITFTEQSSGTSVVTITAQDDNGGSVTDEFNVGVNLLTQTITFNSSYVKTYGDGAFELSASASSNRTVAFSSSNASILTISGTTATIKGAGTVRITASQSGGDPYAPAQEVTKDLTIAKATITAKADNTSMVYGGTAPAYTISYSGFVGTDDKAVLDTLASGVTVSPVLGGVGTYTLRVNQNAADNNYVFTYLDGSLTVTPASLVVTAGNQTKVYGQDNPELTVSYAGFVNDETFTALTTAVTIGTTAAKSSSVGQYPIQITGGVAANYTISYVGGLLSVTPKALAVTADAKSKVYGEADPSLTYVLTGTLETGDVLTGELSRVDGENAGTYTISQNTLTAGANYAISYTEGLLTVTPKALTVTADTKSKVYGEADPALTYVLTGTLETGDALTGELSREAGENAGTYAIRQNNLMVGENYEITFESSDFTISKKGLVAIAADFSRTFGEQNPEFTITYEGFVGSETAALFIEAPSATTEATPASNVGTYAITLSGGNAANYAFTLVDGELTVSQATASVSITDLEQQADGTPKSPTVTTNPEGLNYTILFDGVAGIPTEAGSYSVLVTIDELNYHGSGEGVFVISSALGINPSEQITVYPNPTSRFIKALSAEEQAFQVYDLEGKMLRTGKTNVELDISDLESGVYLIQLGNRTIRIIKN